MSEYEHRIESILYPYGPIVIKPLTIRDTSQTIDPRSDGYTQFIMRMLRGARTDADHNDIWYHTLDMLLPSNQTISMRAWDTNNDINMINWLYPNSRSVVMRQPNLEDIANNDLQIDPMFAKQRGLAYGNLKWNGVTLRLPDPQDGQIISQSNDFTFYIHRDFPGVVLIKWGSSAHMWSSFEGLPSWARVFAEVVNLHDVEVIYRNYLDLRQELLRAITVQMLALRCKQGTSVVDGTQVIVELDSGARLMTSLLPHELKVLTTSQDYSYITSTPDKICVVTSSLPHTSSVTVIPASIFKQITPQPVLQGPPQPVLQGPPQPVLQEPPQPILQGPVEGVPNALWVEAGFLTPPASLSGPGVTSTQAVPVPLGSVLIPGQPSPIILENVQSTAGIPVWALIIIIVMGLLILFVIGLAITRYIVKQRSENLEQLQVVTLSA